MYKGYKIRLFPTCEQEELLWKHIHASRFIWNYMLNLQEDNYKNGKPFMYRFDLINHVTYLKKQEGYEWLNEVSRDTLNRTCTDLSLAYDMFFKKIYGHPRFKSKKTRRFSYPVCDLAKRFYLMPGYAKIQKLGKIKMKTNLEVPYGNDKKYSNPRISYVHNKWILTFELECESQATNKSSESSMGIDLGIKDLATVSFGDKIYVYKNINKSKRVRTLNKKLKHLNKVLMRKYRTNKNYERTQGVKQYIQAIKDVEYKLSCIRNNYIHQITSQLVKLNPCQVTMETLDIAEMMRNKYTAPLIKELCLHEFIRQVKYKCMYNGISFVQVGMYYPSSKTCSNCGYIKKKFSVSERTYSCPNCGMIKDRDENAAINLMRYVSHTERHTA